jgi:Ca2+-transporting ATPase
MTGEQVMTTDPKTLQKMAKEINVFARMYPEAKLKLIEALKSNHEIVAMTGDGVNDGPALKAAHIGIAMGKGGSEVARKAASLVLLDDDLSWMVDAIALGRRIYENLKKAIMYIISIHIPIILIVALPLLFFWKYANIFSPIHVIFLELIMGPTCSIIFENEPIEANSMQKPPRQLGIDLFSYRELTVSIMQGLIITATCLGLGYYFMFIGSSESLVRTVIYTTLIFCNIFLTLVNRSFYYSLLSTIRYNNYLIPLIIFISVVILLASIYIQAIQSLFKFEKIPVSTIGLCMVFAFFGVIWVEIVKWYRRASLKNSQTT